MLQPSLQAWVALRHSTLNTIEILIELAELDEADKVRANLARCIDLLALSNHPFDAIEGARQ
jgi:hypothetical protein